MKSAAAIFGLVLFSLVLSACGKDIDPACKDFVQTVQDCGNMYRDVYTDSWCEGFSELDCDLSGYYRCLSEALGECDSGVFPNIDDQALNACAAHVSYCAAS